VKTLWVAVIASDAPLGWVFLGYCAALADSSVRLIGSLAGNTRDFVRPQVAYATAIGWC
jgi:hypothetical protein